MDGLAIVGGILAGMLFAAWLTQAYQHVLAFGFWVVLGGLLGARLWGVFFPSAAARAVGRTTAWLLRNPLDLNDGILALWTGDYHELGAVLGGALGLAYAVHRLPNRAAWLDVGITATAFGAFVCALLAGLSVWFPLAMCVGMVAGRRFLPSGYLFPLYLICSIVGNSFDSALE